MSKPRADYRAIADLRDKIAFIAERLGFAISAFKVEEYPGAEWDEPLEIVVSIKQRAEDDVEEEAE